MAKIHIKMGDVEVEYEGDEEFLKKDLPQLIERVTSLAKATGKTVAPAGSTPSVTRAGISPSDAEEIPTTGLIAAKLNAESGPDLAMAAALRLSMSGTLKFNRKALVTEMRSAHGIFKDSYASNLTATLKTLMRGGRLHDAGSSSYSLPKEEKDKLQRLVEK